MVTNYFTVIFWYDFFDNYMDYFEDLKKLFKNEYDNINILNNEIADETQPVISAYNNDLKTNFSFSKIFLQYSQDNHKFSDFKQFYNKCLEIFNYLEACNIKVKHTSIIVSLDKQLDLSNEQYLSNMLNNDFIDSNIVDFSFKFGKKVDDQFYKIIKLFNKKKISIPYITDEKSRKMPIPLISWKEMEIGEEFYEFNYELNDKYLFDNEKDYNTTEFYLNKMLYIIENNLEDDLKKIVGK